MVIFDTKVHAWNHLSYSNYNNRPQDLTWALLWTGPNFKSADYPTYDMSLRSLNLPGLIKRQKTGPGLPLTPWWILIADSMGPEFTLVNHMPSNGPMNHLYSLVDFGSRGLELTLVNHMPVMGPGLTLAPRRTGEGPGSDQQWGPPGCWQ